jgi:O-antigen ligase
MQSALPAANAAGDRSDRKPATMSSMADTRAPRLDATGGIVALWGAYLLVAPTWGFGWIDSWHNEQRAVQALLLAATALAGPLLVPWHRFARIPREAATRTAAVGIFGAAAAAGAAFVPAAFAELSLHALLGLLAAITAAWVRDDPVRTMRWVRRACVLLALAHVVGVASRYAAMVALERAPNLDVLLLGYANPRFPSALYALLMPGVAWLAGDPRERPALRGLAFVALVLLWTVNVALGTRAIWFAFALAMPVLVLLAGWPRVARGTLVLAASAALGAGVQWLLFSAVPAWLGLGSELPSRLGDIASLSERGPLWTASLRLIAAHPLLGVGPMNFAALGDSFAAHPHNWVLQIAVEWGVPALAISCWALWRLMRAVRRRLAAIDDVAFDLPAPLAAVLVGLSYGLVDGNLVMPVSQTAFVLMLGALAGCVFAGGETAVGASMRASAGVVIAVLAAASMLAWFALTTLPRQPAIEQAWRQTSQYPYLAPRFWQQGLLR